MKLGRLPRARNPRVPHFSALTAGITLPTPPPSIDYTVGLPASLGMFGNDSLGDCTCAALYHALQVWTCNGIGAIDTEPDQNAVLLYEAACHYNPADPKTDQGGVEQDVLTYALLNGIPTGPAGGGRHQLSAFVEVDPRNIDDVKLSIFDCGVAYIGFNVPDYLMRNGPPPVWDVLPSANYQIEGGHAVVLAGYDPSGVSVVSWGRLYTMTWAFFTEFTDEVYAIADPAWIRATGATPAGMTLPQLEAQMSGLREQNQ